MGEPVPELGDVQQTLYIPLLARARYTRTGGSLLHDPKAIAMVEALRPDTIRFGGSGEMSTVLRTAMYDHWVRRFLDAHPDGTVVELGSGLNTRFERLDNGRLCWFDVDLPDTVALRRRFFEDSPRRRTIAASVLNAEWLDEVSSAPGPHFLVTEGVLVYLKPDEVHRAIRQIAERLPGAGLALDVYSAKLTRREHELAARKNFARWNWPCDDPAELEPLGLRLREIATFRRAPAGMTVPWNMRTRMALLDLLAGGLVTLALFDVG
jgi:O-methyltransferase involved in polyketide biosynthesis